MKKTGKYRITHVSSTGARKIRFMTERQLHTFRAKRMKTIRKEILGMTQKDLAKAVGANVRTLQDWERGRSAMPKPVEILIELMRDLPAIRKRLIAVAG